MLQYAPWTLWPGYNIEKGRGGRNVKIRHLKTQEFNETGLFQGVSQLLLSMIVGVMARNFALSFSLISEHFLHVSGSIMPIALILASFQRSFPPAEVEYRWCQFRSKVVTSEVEERPRLVTGDYGRHRSQWVKTLQIMSIWNKINYTRITDLQYVLSITSCWLLLCWNKKRKKTCSVIKVWFNKSCLVLSCLVLSCRTWSKCTPGRLFYTSHTGKHRRWCKANFVSLKAVLTFQTLMLAMLGKWVTTHDRVLFLGKNCSWTLLPGST